MMNENDYVLFEAYLEESLTDADKISFENRLKADALFFESFTIYTEATNHFKNKFTQEAETLSFEDNLNTISNTHFKKQAPKVIRFKPWKYATAACLLLFSGILFYMNSLSGIPSYEELNTISEINIVERSSNSELLIKAEAAYNTKSFSEAKNYFAQILANDPTNAELIFYKAITQLELSEYSEAENLLTGLSTGTSVYADDALWYLALSKLKQENHESCKQVLRSIPATSANYTKAQNLLNKLE